MAGCSARLHVHNHFQSLSCPNAVIAFNDPFGVYRRFLATAGDGVDNDYNLNVIFGGTQPNNTPGTLTALFLTWSRLGRYDPDAPSI